MSSMVSSNEPTIIGVLLSGGVDSSILTGQLLAQGCGVQPFYIRSGLYWERAEQTALHRYLQAVATPALSDLVTLDLPLSDLYQDHWSITGQDVPAADTPDEAVYLPGRNILLIIKAALWCQLHGIGQLALAPLGNNPFEDATIEFFDNLEATLGSLGQRRVEILRPFAALSKREVMDLGRKYPLDLTFSCIAPRGQLHCGRCNKCGERQAAFRAAKRADRTQYDAPASLKVEG